MKTNSVTIRMVAALSVLFLVGCGKEVGRLPFAAEDSKAITMPLAAGDVAFWTDIDVSYEARPLLPIASIWRKVAAASPPPSVRRWGP